MYDVKEINKVEMNEWLDDTIDTMRNVDRLLDVLEFGMVSEMIPFNFHNCLRTYVGLEMSQTAVDFVSKAAKSIQGLQNPVGIFQGTASCLN